MIDRLYITGCDASTEWQLDFFVPRFREHNPNAELMIFDFGMETSKYSEIRKSHRTDETGWFKKPSAMMKASKMAKEVCWLDTDVEVLGSLDSIFDYVEDDKLAMAIDRPWTSRRGEIWQNSGVVAFRGMPVILGKWVKEVRERPNVGDQEVLHSLLRPDPMNRIVHTTYLPNRYNVLRLQIQDQTLPEKIVCMHWTGAKGNMKIKELMNE